jgi:hypothetical protein
MAVRAGSRESLCTICDHPSPIKSVVQSESSVHSSAHPLCGLLQVFQHREIGLNWPK